MDGQTKPSGCISQLTAPSRLEAFFGRRRTRHEETHQNPISFVAHSLTVQHHGGPSALRRRITIFSYQIRIQYHVWILLKLTVSSDWPPLRIDAMNRRPTFPRVASTRRIGSCVVSRFAARRKLQQSYLVQEESPARKSKSVGEPNCSKDDCDRRDQNIDIGRFASLFDKE